MSSWNCQYHLSKLETHGHNCIYVRQNPRVDFFLLTEYIAEDDTVKPLITNTSEEFIKCRLDNFLMSFIIYYVNFSTCKNK